MNGAYLGMKYSRWRYLGLRAGVVCMLYFTVVMIVNYPGWRHEKQCVLKCLEMKSKKVIDTSNFFGFDNENGRMDGRYVVPNYVHFLRVGTSEDLSFMEAVCILAAMKHQNPTALFMHVDHWPRGKYWDLLVSMKNISDRLIPITGSKLPTKLNGKWIDPNLSKKHGRVIIKLMILMKYGGIAMENESYIVKNMNDYRKYEMTLDDLHDWGSRSTIVIVANKHARLLKIWLNFYLDSYGAVSDLDMEEKVFSGNGHMFHREKYLLANTITAMNYVYLYHWFQWRSHYVLYLNLGFLHHLANKSDLLEYPVTFNEVNINKYNATILTMVYDVYPHSELTKYTNNSYDYFNIDN